MNYGSVIRKNACRRTSRAVNMDLHKKLPALPLASQNRLPKKLSKAKNCLSAIEIFKLNALKALEHSDSGSEGDCHGTDAKAKESPPSGKNLEQDTKISKQAKTNNRVNNRQVTKHTVNGKATRIRRNKVKVNNRMRLPERNIEYLENRIERGPDLTTDSIMEVTTMVSEVTVSDVEREGKSKTRKKERLAPQLSSPDLRRPSSAFRKKTNKAMSKQVGFQNKAEESKEEIKDRPLVELQKYLKMMAECRQNSLGRPKIKPSLYVGSNITRKPETGKKSIGGGANAHDMASSNRSVLTKQVSTTIPTGTVEGQPTPKENRIPVLKFEHPSTPDIKVIPPGEGSEKVCSNTNECSSGDGLSELINKYPSEIPRSAKETWKIYVKLQEQGFPVSLKTLQRALLTPTDQRLLKELFTKSQSVDNSEINEL